MKATAGSSDLADSGYWRTISNAQTYFEDLFNVQFWNPQFGVDMEFKRTYLQDDVREATATQQSLDNIERLEKLECELARAKCQNRWTTLPRRGLK